MSGNGGLDRQRLPASPAEIRRVLVALEQLSRVLLGERDVPAEREASPSLGAVLHGLVLGFEGQVFPVPGDEAGLLGYNVAQSLVKGGTPWL